ncbi:MAG: hypothetical protein AAFX09_04540 [Pseudomonadota bacterium]
MRPRLGVLPFVITSALLMGCASSEVRFEAHSNDERYASCGPTVVKELSEALRGRQADLLYEAEIAEQVAAALAIPNLAFDGAIKGDQRRVFSGCRQHYCPEKSVIVGSLECEFRTAALGHFRNGDTRYETPMLLIISSDADAWREDRPIIEAWASSAYPAYTVREIILTNEVP